MFLGMKRAENMEEIEKEVLGPTAKNLYKIASSGKDQS